MFTFVSVQLIVRKSRFYIYVGGCLAIWCYIKAYEPFDEGFVR
jgi:hypothetical protein